MTRSLLRLLCLGLLSPPALLPQDRADAPNGSSNDGQNQREPYVTAGDRAYLIGTQDGAMKD
jgi:hypothetical protein